jgi:hypothetical protein
MSEKGASNRKRKATENVELICEEYGVTISDIDREFMESFPMTNFDAARFVDLVHKHHDYRSNIAIVPDKDPKRKSDVWIHFGRLLYNGKTLPTKDALHFCICCWQENQKLFW